MKFKFCRNETIAIFGGGFYVGFAYMTRYRSLTVHLGQWLLTVWFGKPR